MVQTSRLAYGSPTDVTAVAPSSTTSSSAAAASSSSSTGGASTNASPSDFFSSAMTSQRGNGNNSSHEDDVELFKLGFMGSSGGGGGNGDHLSMDVDVASAFARVMAADEDDFDTEMRDFELVGDGDELLSGEDDPATSFTANVTMSTKLTVAKAKQPRKKTTNAGTSKKKSTRVKKEAVASHSESNNNSESSVADGSRQQLQEGTLSTLELRRKRNRDSMRRARNRQRNEQEKLESMIDQLEDRLESLMRAKENSLASESSNGDESSGDSSTLSTAYSYSAYSNLLRQTEFLRDENDHLSEQVRKHAHFQDRIGKLADQDKKQVDAEIQADEEHQESELLRPLLTWVTQATCIELVNYGRDRLLEVADLTNTLVPSAQNVLGWQGKRTIHANWAHYMMTKSFQCQSANWLAKRTWDCTVNHNFEEMKQVLSWANGTKVLHRLSNDAVIIARDILVPNLQDVDHPIRIRYILLVFRTAIPNGFLVGTETLNVYGTSVEDCLEQKISHQNGMKALTMYAFLFTRIRSPDTGEDLGTNVTLAGRSGDGSLMYARKVLFEVLPSILRWENTFVAPILRVTG